MCVVSMVGDDWSRKDRWSNWPDTVPFPDRNWPVNIPEPDRIRISKLENELADLKRQFAEMRKELEAAKQQDIDEGNPDCEMDSKVIILKKIADLFGESLDGIFTSKPVQKSKV